MATKKDQRPKPKPGAPRAWIRLDRVRVEPLEDRSGYRVIIDGFNLHRAISPPRVEVGGVPLQQLEFQRDGRCLRGVLAREPANPVTVVDYGFARAEAKIS
jgi:hypothetical protein